ncbi:unnamed protein product [Caenorhabditis sp. 36 PRJEB53466]|nr:unnamed protein product [Caenorhabditis sp. 36 PRJEB53466]
MESSRLQRVYFRFLFALIGCLCYLTSAIFKASELFMLGQVMTGCQMPLRMFVTILYITECAPDKHRGFASTALVFSSVIGQIIMYSVASPNVLGKPNTWFIFPLSAMISSLVIFCLMARLPESPKWLVRQNRMEEAGRSVEYYHGKNCCISEELTSFIREKNLTKEDKISLKQVWENDTLREALKILFAVAIFLICDSATVQSIYAVMLTTKAGFTVQQTMDLNLILTIVFFPTKFIGTYIIDALGRRPVMFIAGTIVFAKSWVMLALQIVIYLCGPSLLTRIMHVGAECLLHAISATGVTSLGILFISELFPPSARTSVAQGLILANLLVNTPIVALFPIVYSFFAPIFFVPYIIIQLMLGTYLYRHMPETRARAVCDIIEELDQEVASRSASILEERTPLIRDRARTLALKRNSILNTPRTRALTFDHKMIPSKWNC